MGSSNSKYIPFKLSQIRFWQIWARCLHSISSIAEKFPINQINPIKNQIDLINKSDQNLFYNGNNFVCRKVPDKSDQFNKKSDQNLSFKGNKVDCRKLFTKSDHNLFSAPSFPLTGWVPSLKNIFKKYLFSPSFSVPLSTFP